MKPSVLVTGAGGQLGIDVVARIGDDGDVIILMPRVRRKLFDYVADAGLVGIVDDQDMFLHK
ncbi:MAG: hypothetical protein IH940_10140 [Acidobacteria bacterium]|nr:hypothetical protein [Acidobacteriota bacterium]